MENLQGTLAVIDGIKSVTDAGELQKLEVGLDELFKAPFPERGIETLFRLFERFPNDDGYGVFWTVLHGIEHQPDYEPHLKASVRHIPTEFNLRMVNRLLNSDLPDGQRQEWLDLLSEVISNPSYSEDAKAEA